FTARVERDSDLAWVKNTAYPAIDQIDSPDPSTLTITWKQPFVDADSMFGSVSQRGLPLPRHLLERTYTDDKTSFLQLPYWSQEFIGSGAFKLTEWVPDSHLTLEAFPAYVLGRPKIDQIEVRLVGDTNTVVANILAGGVDLTLDGRTIPFEDGRNLAGQWQGGRLELGLGGVVTIFTQFLNPDPQIVANVQFRRALMHALDRQELVDTIQGGFGGVAHTYLGPGQIEYSEIESALVKYDYDPRKAAQLIEGLGYFKGADGVYRDGANQKLSFPFHTTITTVNQKSTLATADAWQRAGLEPQVETIPLQRQADLAFMNTLPAFHLIRIGRNVTAFQSLRSNQAAVPENNFTGANRGRYQSPELDTLIDHYFAAIPRADRMRALGEVLHFVTDQLPVMNVLFDPDAIMVSNRLKNVESGSPWKSEQWEIVREG
ncbi:MAG TPA: ABC transporter substrate-binding protein, partial [Chloroflexota bacterium]